MTHIHQHSIMGKRVCVCVHVCVRTCVCMGRGGQAIREGEEGLKAKVQRSVLSWVG